MSRPQCRHAFGLKQEGHIRWTRDRSRVNWEEFVCCQVRANETYSEAMRQFSDRNRVVLIMNVQSPHKWWSTLKSAVFCTSSSLPPLVSEGGELVCESVGKADLLSDHFDSKQFREAADLPLTCHPSPSLTVMGCKSYLEMLCPSHGEEEGDCCSGPAPGFGIVTRTRL